MTETTLPSWQAARLTVLLDALSGVPISDAERRSLMWLAGFEAQTVENVAAVITRARQAREGSSSLVSPPHRGVRPGVAPRGIGEGLGEEKVLDDGR